ncbi:hypothetical protein Tco_1540432 [Tanacetum coccineum]
MCLPHFTKQSNQGASLNQRSKWTIQRLVYKMTGSKTTLQGSLLVTQARINQAWQRSTRIVRVGLEEAWEALKGLEASPIGYK